MYFKTDPFEHQIECLKLASKQPYFAFFCEPGLGKTKIAIDLVANRTKSYGTYKTLVVCPNTIVENWYEEVLKHSDLTPVMLTGTRARRLKRMQDEGHFFIINYESTRLLTSQLIDQRYDCVVFDESTALKDPSTLQSKACYKISQNIAHRYILTGTPVMNSPLDVFGQYRVLDPNIFGRSHFRFKHRYAIWGGFGGHTVKNYRNIGELRKKIFSCAVHKTKDECLDLPDKLYQKISVAMPDQQAEVYRALKKDFISEFRGTLIAAPIVLTRLVRFSQITAGFTKDLEGVEHEFDRNPKIEWLLDFLKDTEHKVIVFCRFKKEIEIVEKALGKAKISYVQVSGNVKQGGRQELVNTFNNDPDVKVFVGQMRTTGVGLNLTAAKYSVFMSNLYSHGERVQCEDRFHRIGQDKNITCIDLVMEGSVDISIYKTLKAKKNLANMVVKDIVNLV